MKNNCDCLGFLGFSFPENDLFRKYSLLQQKGENALLWQHTLKKNWYSGGNTKVAMTSIRLTINCNQYIVQFYCSHTCILKWHFRREPIIWLQPGILNYPAD